MKIGDMDMTDLAWIAAQTHRRVSREVVAEFNTERVRSFMEQHLGCTNREVAYGLQISYTQAARAVRKLRAEWRGRHRGGGT